MGKDKKQRSYSWIFWAAAAALATWALRMALQSIMNR